MPNVFKTFFLTQVSKSKWRFLKSCTSKGPKCTTRLTQDWLEEKFHQYACQIFCWMSFPLHIGSTSAKNSGVLCVVTLNWKEKWKGKGKEWGRHLTTMLISDPASLCCFLLRFSPVESCSGNTTGKLPPCFPENIQDLNNLGADDTVVTLSFTFSGSFETFNYAVCTFH